MSDAGASTVAANATPVEHAAVAVATAQRWRVTWAARLSERDARDYDAFVEAAPAGHFAQARRWSAVACAGRPFTASYVLVRDAAGTVHGAAQVLRARAAGIPLPYATVERGPVVAEPAVFGPVLRAIARAARRRGIARLDVMPYWDDATGAPVRTALQAGGWCSIQKAGGAHAATLRLALPRDPATALYTGSEHKKLRQEVRYAERAGASAGRGAPTDLPRFVALYRALMQEQALHAKPDAWFAALAAFDFSPAGDVGLFFTEYAGQAVAGALTIRHGALVTLLLAASARTPPPAPAHKFARMVPALVAAIDWARSRGCDFDLGGVPMTGDDDAKRAAIAQFKRDFSRTRLDLIGQHARWLLAPL
jgi:hypothetical protein